MQPTWDMEKGPELFPLYPFFPSSLCLSSAPVTPALHVSPAARARGATAVPPHIPPLPSSLQGSSCRQRNPPGREVAVGLHSDA